jgi:hypothetical protein
MRAGGIDAHCGAGADIPATSPLEAPRPGMAPMARTRFSMNLDESLTEEAQARRTERRIHARQRQLRTNTMKCST